MSKNFDVIIESIEKMTVLELNDLVKALEEKFGVSAASMGAGVAVADRLVLCAQLGSRFYGARLSEPRPKSFRVSIIEIDI